MNSVMSMSAMSMNYYHDVRVIILLFCSSFQRRKSVRIDKMKKDKNLQLLELPAKRK